MLQGIEFGELSVEYLKDFVQPGHKPKCAACRKSVNFKAGVIAIKRSQFNDKGVRSPIYLCKRHARTLAFGIEDLLKGEER